MENFLLLSELHGTLLFVEDQTVLYLVKTVPEKLEIFLMDSDCKNVHCFQVKLFKSQIIRHGNVIVGI